MVTSCIWSRDKTFIHRSYRANKCQVDNAFFSLKKKKKKNPITLTYLCNLMLSLIAQWTALFRKKNCGTFLIYDPTVDCGSLLERPQWGGSNKHPQSMSRAKNKKNNVYPCKPHFSYIKWYLQGCSLHRLFNVMRCASHTKVLTIREKHTRSGANECSDQEIIGHAAVILTFDVASYFMGLEMEFFKW